ncbi:MAG: starch-binding protein, partial [Alistipes sp.]|nr:starch-binding protein [Alistipes sp.]
VEVKALKIYGDVSATGWTACYAWIWDSSSNYTGGNWPGEALSMEGNYYVWNVPASLMGATVNVIFSNGEGDQTVDINGVVLSDDVLITLTDNEGGKWNATVNGEAPVEPEKPAETTYGLIGEFNGWGEDVDLVARGDGWYVTEALSVTAGKLLIRLNDAWDEKFGNDGSTLVIGENTLTYGGADMLIEAGTYDFYFNPSSSKLFLVNAGDEDPTAGLVASISYGLVGTINGWAAPDVKFEAIGDGGYKLLGYTLAATEQIKIRANEEWNDAENYGLASAGVLTTNAANTLICGGGSANMSVAADGTYDFYFYPAELTLYVMEAGQVPAR